MTDIVAMLRSGESDGDAWWQVMRDAADEIERLRAALERARVVLDNMAMENEGAIFDRWPISHEPLRADAKNLLPVIRAALATQQEQK